MDHSFRLVRTVDDPFGAYALLPQTGAVVIPAVYDREACSRWTGGVYRAREQWNHDFGGEQFSLGRAFYTHFEEDRSEAYFADPASSDASVEEFAPGLQRSMLDLVRTVIGGKEPVIQRRGWCGPGIHVFPPSGPVAENGGVCHFDVEGLTARQIAQRAPAITLVAVLQPVTKEGEGGLRVWDVLYDGHVYPRDEEVARPSALATYDRAGQVVLIDSYRLHQIQPFGGSQERITATVHCVRSDAAVWECWF